MATEGVRLSVDDAVDFLCKCFTRKYRAECIEHWRGLYGDEYANDIQARLIVKFEKRKQEKTK